MEPLLLCCGGQSDPTLARSGWRVVAASGRAVVGATAAAGGAMLGAVEFKVPVNGSVDGKIFTGNLFNFPSNIRRSWTPEKQQTIQPEAAVKLRKLLRRSFKRRDGSKMFKTERGAIMPTLGSA